MSRVVRAFPTHEGITAKGETRLKLDLNRNLVRVFRGALCHHGVVVHLSPRCGELEAVVGATGSSGGRTV